MISSRSRVLVVDLNNFAIIQPSQSVHHVPFVEERGLKFPYSARSRSASRESCVRKRRHGEAS